MADFAKLTPMPSNHPAAVARRGRIGQRDVLPLGIKNRHVDNLILGGVNNKEGSITVRDAANTDRVVIDKDGVVVEEGKIVIKDEDAVTIIDSKGVVSTALSTFSGSANGSLNQSFTTTSEVDVTGSSLEFTLSRSAIALVMATVDAYVVPDGANETDLIVRIKLDADDKERMIWLKGAGNENLSTSSTHFLETLSAATYTLKLTGKLEGWTSAATATVYGFRLTYIILGK